jgi:uncharacterized membrane protein YebE (DUF533 family)
MNVRYRIELSQAERGALAALLSGGKHAARKLKRAQILLAADAGVAPIVRRPWQALRLWLSTKASSAPYSDRLGQKLAMAGGDWQQDTILPFFCRLSVDSQSR